MKDFLKDFWVIIKKYYWIAFTPVFLIAYYSSQQEKEDIEKNKSITYGIVKGSRSIVKKFSKRNYDYYFYVDGQKFSGSSTGWLSDNINNGNYYVVEFSSKSPEHSRMDFEIEYSPVAKKNTYGQVDTTYVRTSELKINIPKEYKSRIESLRMESGTDN